MQLLGTISYGTCETDAVREALLDSSSTRYSSLSPKIASFLKKQSPLVMAENPPGPDALRKLKVKRPKLQMYSDDAKDGDPADLFFKPENEILAAKEALKLAQYCRPPSRCLFLGGGMKPTFRILSNLLHDTPAENQMMHIPLSAPLLQEKNLPALKSYMDRLGFGQADPQHPIYIIDTVGPETRNWGHELLAFTRLAREKLNGKKVDPENSIIPVGIPELNSHDYAQKSLAGYKAAVSNTRRSGKPPRPYYVKVDMDFQLSTALYFTPRWGSVDPSLIFGKYRTFASDGTPSSGNSRLDRLLITRSGDLNAYRQEIKGRLYYLGFYSQLEQDFSRLAQSPTIRKLILAIPNPLSH